MIGRDNLLDIISKTSFSVLVLKEVPPKSEKILQVELESSIK